MRYFEDFEVGIKREVKGSYHFTESEIVDFATRWDPQPFHIDKAAAEKSMFKGLVACSSHIITASMSIGLTSESEKSAAVSALGFSEMRVILPVRPGDTLRSVEEFTETRLSNSHPGCGIVNCQVEVFNQRDELVFAFQTAALMKCRQILE